MGGMYLGDLEDILYDVRRKCKEIIKEKYPTDEYTQRIIGTEVYDLISNSIEQVEIDSWDGHQRCKYGGRYGELFNSRNPRYNRSESNLTPKIPDIDSLSLEEYQEFLEYYNAIIDANGQLYYYYKWYDASVRSMNKALKISTNGMKTPKIQNLEKRN